MLSPFKDLSPNHFKHPIEVLIDFRIQDPDNSDSERLDKLLAFPVVFGRARLKVAAELPALVCFTFAVKELVHGLFPWSFCIPLARPEQSFSIAEARAPPPPNPPLCKGGKEDWSLLQGGKRIGRSRSRSIAHTKNTRLEPVPPVRSTPAFHQRTLDPRSRRDHGARGQRGRVLQNISLLIRSRLSRPRGGIPSRFLR